MLILRMDNLMALYRVFWRGPNEYRVDHEELKIYLYYPSSEVAEDKSNILKLEGIPEEGDILREDLKVRLVLDFTNLDK